MVYNGAIHCLRHTIETKGFMSLYNGISSPLLGSMAENAVLFLAYNEIKRQMTLSVMQMRVVVQFGCFIER